MFKIVEEALEKYKKMLKEYICKTNKMKKFYGNNEFLSWERRDYEYVLNWVSKFAAIEKVLGLTKEEVNDIEKRVSEELAKE